jgi:hypothetical protein
MTTRSHVLSALIAKRTELAGKFEYTETQLRQLLIDLDALDQTILMFKPHIDLKEIQPKPMPPRHSAFKGQMARLLLDTLRSEGKPMSVHDMTLRVMMVHGMNTSDRRLCRLMSKRVGASLRNMRARGVVC